MKHMVLKNYLLISFISILSLTNSAIAETISSDVRAGRANNIYNYALYDPGRCRGMALPKLGTIKSGNGRITTRKGTQTLDRGQCKGTVIKSLSIFYTPERGFKGKDKVSVVLLFPLWVDDTGHKAKKIKFNLTVK